MHLAIDIGNTAAKLGAFKGEELLEVAYTNNNTLLILTTNRLQNSISLTLLITTILWLALTGIRQELSALGVQP
mgnify:CR=1 FL=1